MCLCFKAASALKKLSFARFHCGGMDYELHVFSKALDLVSELIREKVNLLAGV